jgi:hypothetical protein
MKNVLDKSCRENQNTHFMLANVLKKIVPFMRCGKKYSRTGDAKWQYGACAFHAESLRLRTYTRNTQYLLLFHCNIGYEEPESYVICTLSACRVYISLPCDYVSILYQKQYIFTRCYRLSCVKQSHCGPMAILLEYIFLFGATAPSGTRPPRSRGF